MPDETPTVYVLAGYMGASRIIGPGVDVNTRVVMAASVRSPEEAYEIAQAEALRAYPPYLGWKGHIVKLMILPTSWIRPAGVQATLMKREPYDIAREYDPPGA